MGSILQLGDTDVFYRDNDRIRIQTKEGKEMTKDEIIVALAEQLAEMRHDRDLWKALYRDAVDRSIEQENK